jgi:glycosyltransferase involved in cell wall biosynthesis
MADANHTFVILAYKNSIYLEDCIKSLLQQTIRSKISIATSTPSEFIAGMAAKYDFEVLINENGPGIASDWNFAYKACNTKYITLAHQDDVYLPGYTELCIHHAEKKSNSNSLLVFTDYREIKNAKEVKFSLIILVKKLLLFPFLVKDNFSNRFIKRSILSFGNPISCPTVMFNVDNIGPFEFSDKYQYNLDWEAWLRLAKVEGKFIYVNQKLMLHRIHNESQTILQIQDDNRLREEEMIFTTIWNKTIAKLLMMVYRYSSHLNIKKPD